MISRSCTLHHTLRRPPSDVTLTGTSIPKSDSFGEVEMSTSLVMRAILAATALCLAPAIASAQGPATKACKDGTTSTRSTFACFGHGGVDTAHAAARDHAPAEPVQAGEPR